jgi:hypothetical protein
MISETVLEKSVCTVIDELQLTWKVLATRIRMARECEVFFKGTGDFQAHEPQIAGLPIEFSGMARPEVAYVYGGGGGTDEIVYEIDLTNGSVRQLAAERDERSGDEKLRA